MNIDAVLFFERIQCETECIKSVIAAALLLSKTDSFSMKEPLVVEAQ